MGGGSSKGFQDKEAPWSCLEFILDKVHSGDLHCAVATSLIPLWWDLDCCGGTQWALSRWRVLTRKTFPLSGSPMLLVGKGITTTKTTSFVANGRLPRCTFHLGEGVLCWDDPHPIICIWGVNIALNAITIKEALEVPDVSNAEYEAKISEMDLRWLRNTLVEPAHRDRIDWPTIK
ncbi:hypothetical protein KY284_016351 [Solanum tuberosum]|nr:hypothetical protein KY284_016351 [Solanum tuberosum]